MFNIRLARKADIPAIDLLYANSYPKLLKPDYPPSILVTVVPMFSKSQPKLVASGTYFVAEGDDGEIIGAGGWTTRGPMGEVEPGLGHVRHFATDPSAVRLGVGRGLMVTCFEQAKDQGRERLSCYSTITAVPFYEALGFEKCGDIEIEFGGGLRLPAVSMICDIQ